MMRANTGSPIQPRDKLDAVYDLIEVLMQPLHSAGADPVGLNQLLDASIAHADQRKLRCSEESVGRHQQQDQQHPQQDKSNHGTLILTFQRFWSCARRRTKRAIRKKLPGASFPLNPKAV
jgi:hypothetical protein